MDLPFKDKNPILHIVETHSADQSATVIRGKRPDNLWHAFVECWASLYTEYPNIIRLDQEAGFTPKAFMNLTTAQKMSPQCSGAQSNNSIGAKEKYHEPLRRVFRILRQ